MAKAKVQSLTLALAGGGARCAAHAGVLAVFAEYRLPVAAIAGVSGGGLVGVLHALGLPPLAIRDYFAETQLLEVWEFDTTRRAMFGAEKIRARVRQVVGDKTFADLKIPVTVVAADLFSGHEIRLNRGSLLDALMATLAIPAVITPKLLNSWALVDGGIVNPLPVDVARQMGQRVVAIDLGAPNPSADQYAQLFEARGPMQYATEIAKRLQVNGIMETAHQASVITTQKVIELMLTLYPPDVVIRPPVGYMGMFAFDLADEAYKHGEAATRAQLDSLIKLVQPTWRTQLTSAWQHMTKSKSRRDRASK